MLSEFYSRKQKIWKMLIIKESHFFNQVTSFYLIFPTKTELGTGKKSWMNDQLVHELEKRGLRRSRGIKRIISTHKKRMGFMFTISLAFIISGLFSDVFINIIFSYLVGYLFNTSNPSFSSWPIRLGCFIILYIIMFVSLKHVSSFGQTLAPNKPQYRPFLEMKSKSECQSAGPKQPN